jgi:hypothetical protein
MLTALLVLILIVLVLIERDIAAFREAMRDTWKCSTCRGSGHALNAADPEERCGACFGSGTVIGETNARLAQITGALDRMHNTTLKLWACPPALVPAKSSLTLRPRPYLIF